MEKHKFVSISSTVRDRAISLKFLTHRVSKKCTIGNFQMSFFGHVLSKDGLKAGKKKVEAIKNMPSPTNKGELESVLGMLIYLSAFAPMLSDMTAPLRELTRRNTVFKWDCSTESIFQKVKDVIM